MELEFTEQAQKDLKYWKKINNLAVQKRISTLLEAIKEEPYTGIGNPEALKHQLTGLWSRRINREHRLVYEVLEDKIVIYALRFHY